VFFYCILVAFFQAPPANILKGGGAFTILFPGRTREQEEQGNSNYFK